MSYLQQLYMLRSWHGVTPSLLPEAISHTSSLMCNMLRCNEPLEDLCTALKMLAMYGVTSHDSTKLHAPQADSIWHGHEECRHLPWTPVLISQLG